MVMVPTLLLLATFALEPSPSHEDVRQPCSYLDMQISRDAHCGRMEYAAIRRELRRVQDAIKRLQRSQDVPRVDE
jgi:hypothetical protein